MELWVKIESMLYFCSIVRQELGELVSSLGLYGRVRFIWLVVGGGFWFFYFIRILVVGEDLLMIFVVGSKLGFFGIGFLGDVGGIF